MSLYSRVGKVYLSLMTADKRRRVLNKIGLPAVTHNTITDMQILEQQIRDIQNKRLGL
jgi:DNA-binding IclR family transcriptional regulator